MLLRLPHLRFKRLSLYGLKRPIIQLEIGCLLRQLTLHGHIRKDKLRLLISLLQKGMLTAMNHPAASSVVSVTFVDASIAPRGGEFDPQRLNTRKFTWELWIRLIDYSTLGHY